MVATRCCPRAGGGLAMTSAIRGYAGLPAPSGATAGAARGLFAARQLCNGLAPEPVTNSSPTHHTTTKAVTGWWRVGDGFGDGLRYMFAQVERVCDGCGGFLRHCPTIVLSSSKTPGRVFSGALKFACLAPMSPKPVTPVTPEHAATSGGPSSAPRLDLALGRVRSSSTTE